MKRMYRLEVYSNNGYEVFFNECEADSVESAVEQFARELINIHEYDPDFDDDAAYAILDALRERFTVRFERMCAEMGPTDVEYDFTILSIQLDD